MSEDGIIPGFKVDLDADRHVWVGHKDPDFFLWFKNGEVDTRLRLSEEAASALIQLLSGFFITDHGEAVKWLVTLSEAIAEGKGETRWQRVKPQT
jgi:hypothetical protein